MLLYAHLDVIVLILNCYTVRTKLSSLTLDLHCAAESSKAAKRRQAGYVFLKPLTLPRPDKMASLKRLVPR